MEIGPGAAKLEEYFGVRFCANTTTAVLQCYGDSTKKEDGGRGGVGMPHPTTPHVE